MEANKNRCVPHLSQNYFWTCPILTICAYQREDHRGSGLVISDATLARTVLVLLLSVFLKTRFLVLAKITSTNFVFLERSLLCVDLRNHFISKMSQSKLESPHCSFQSLCYSCSLLHPVKGCPNPDKAYRYCCYRCLN